MCKLLADMPSSAEELKAAMGSYGCQLAIVLGPAALSTNICEEAFGKVAGTQMGRLCVSV